MFGFKKNRYKMNAHQKTVLLLQKSTDDCRDVCMNLLYEDEIMQKEVIQWTENPNSIKTIPHVTKLTDEMCLEITVTPSLLKSECATQISWHVKAKKTQFDAIVVLLREARSTHEQLQFYRWVEDAIGSSTLSSHGILLLLGNISNRDEFIRREEKSKLGNFIKKFHKDNCICFKAEMLMESERKQQNNNLVKILKNTPHPCKSGNFSVRKMRDFIKYIFKGQNGVIVLAVIITGAGFYFMRGRNFNLWIMYSSLSAANWMCSCPLIGFPAIMVCAVVSGLFVFCRIGLSKSCHAFICTLKVVFSMLHNTLKMVFSMLHNILIVVRRRTRRLI